MQYITYDVCDIVGTFKLSDGYIKKAWGLFNILLQIFRDFLNYTEEMVIHQTHGLFCIKLMEIVSV